VEEYERDGGGTSGNKHSVTTDKGEFWIEESVAVGKDMGNTRSYLKG